MALRIRNYIHTSRASRGQIIIMVALFAVAAAGMIGLSIDLGYTFAERRSVQNAADAAAMAGAHALTQWSTSNSMLAASTDVAAVVDGNKMNSSTTQTYSCTYIDDSGQDLGQCSNPVPATATGVHVVVHETHDTFFIRVVPGGPKSISTSASATAHVQGITSGVGGDSPFILCGIDTALAGGGTLSVLQNGTSDVQPNYQMTASILTYSVVSGSQYHVQFLNNGNGNNPTPTPTSSGTSGGSSSWTINPNAYRNTFILHDGNPHNIADCNTPNSSFKGLGDPDSNYGKSVPGWFDSLKGTKAGPTRARVNGINGCAAGVTYSDVNNCVLIVPIASQSSGDQFYVVTVAAFLVSQCGANCHQGYLLPDYQIQPDGMGQWTGSNDWKPGDQGLVAVRLTK